MLKMIKIYLTGFPAELELVRNGRSALKMLRNADYDLMVTDLQMPEIDGFELVRRLRESGSSMPVIILSAFSKDKLVEEVLEAGANQMLTKPFDSGTLQRAIKEELNLS